MHRHALTAAGLLVALTAVGAQAHAQAQYHSRPNDDTPRILIPTFHSPERGLGAETGDEVRDRVIQDINVKQLYALSKTDIKNFLESSGYRADSALSPNDLKELAKLMRADEILDGTVTRTANGVQIQPRLMLSRDVALVQPLPVVEAKNPGDAARQIVRSLDAANKQMKDNKDCENAIRAGNNDLAIASALKGIQAYPQATLARLCLATALQAKKAPADSIIAVTNQVLAIDPRSRIALGLKYGAQRDKGDSDAALATLMQMVAADPTNQTLIEQAVSAIATSPKPELAVPLIDSLVAQNPGDPNLVRTQWLVLLRANQFKRGLEVGEQLAKLDSTAADSSWYTRMIATAAADSQPQLAAQYAARAVGKYPNSANFLALQSEALRKSGQLPQALEAIKKAIAINPKVENGYLTAIVLNEQLNQPDSALAMAKQAIAAGQDKETIGNALLAGVSPLIQKAQASKTREDWMAVFSAANGINQLAPTPNSNFYTGIAAFQIGLDALQNLNKTKSCAEVKLAEDMWATAQIDMTAGAKVDTNTAGQILGAINQYSSNIQQAKKAVCK